MWWWDERLLRGMGTYAHEAGWVLNAQDRHRMHQVWSTPRRRVDGVISLAVTREVLDGFKVPVVDLSNVHDEAEFPKVIADDPALGMAAAEHFISRGIEDIGFVDCSDGGNATENDRRRSLQQAVEKMGRRFHRLQRRGLSARLRRLPKPVGLMAVNDETMVELMESCLERGFKIPEEVALLGVDDVESVCELAPVPLSSVNLDFERRGYVAASLLDRLMDGHAPPKRPVVVPIRGVTARQSTDLLAIKQPQVAAALRYICDHFREPLRVSDVMRHIHLSRQAMQRHFRRHVGHSMHEEISRRRIEEAKGLLRKTNIKIDVVALSSGFSDRLQFHRTFVRIVGVPPARWRQEQRV